MDPLSALKPSDCNVYPMDVVKYQQDGKDTYASVIVSVNASPFLEQPATVSTTLREDSCIEHPYNNSRGSWKQGNMSLFVWRPRASRQGLPEGVAIRLFPQELDRAALLILNLDVHTAVLGRRASPGDDS